MINGVDQTCYLYRYLYRYERSEEEEVRKVVGENVDLMRYDQFLIVLI